MKRIRIQRPRARARHDWDEALPPDPRDPDVVRAKALARAGDRTGSQAPSPQQGATAKETP